MEFDGQVFSLRKFSLWAGFHYGQVFSGEAALQDSLGRSPRNRNLQLPER
jgi:hypothetical protein